jgi:tetratricopeptide (TPR) repeat protein
MCGQATSPSSSAPQKNWKDRAEYDLFDAITKDNNPKTKLEKLQQWVKQYPQTDYVSERRTLLLATYFQLGMAKDAAEVAKQVLADDPNNFSALFITVSFTQALAGLAGQNPTRSTTDTAEFTAGKITVTSTTSSFSVTDVLDQGEKASKALLANLDKTPPNFTEEQWKNQKPQVETLAHTTLGWIALQRKNWQPAEAEFQKALQLNPNDGQVDYYMGTAIASEKDPAKMPTALFYFARAATYEGQGALNPGGRQQVMTYVQRAYKGFHGSDDGFNNLIAAAKSQPLPPADFKIRTATEIAEEQQKKAAEDAAKNPELTLWKNIKAELTGPDGANYFNSGMKEAQLPTLKGKVAKLEPETKPKTLIMALEDGTTADATLKFEMALPGKVEPGTELSFEGVPQSYTASPFMVVFNVEPDHLHGWTGKNAAPVRRPAAKGTKKK